MINVITIIIGALCLTSRKPTISQQPKLPKQWWQKKVNIIFGIRHTFRYTQNIVTANQFAVMIPGRSAT